MTKIKLMDYRDHDELLRQYTDSTTYENADGSIYDPSPLPVVDVLPGEDDEDQ